MSQLIEFPPVLYTERLILRPITIEDIPSYQKNFNDYEIIRYLNAFVPWPYPDNGAEQFYHNIVAKRQGKDYWHWGVFLKDSPQEVIGAVDLWRNSDLDNRGFWLAKKYWGRGYMTEASNRVTDHAFDELGFEVLNLGNAADNVKSRRIKEKQGAKFLGVRPFKYVDPTITESEDWILTKEAWLASKKNGLGSTAQK